MQVHHHCEMWLFLLLITSVYAVNPPTPVPTSVPSTSSPSIFAPPELRGGDGDNFRYYCRPKHYKFNAPNAFQRIEPRINISNSVIVANASVTIGPSYNSTDELSIDGNDALNTIFAKYSAGVLSIEDVTGASSPEFWTEVLRRVTYRFSDSLKPCSEYISPYPREFTFKITDTYGRDSNGFVKTLELTTAKVVIATERTVKISRP